MSLKWMGVLLIVGGCGGFGVAAVLAHKRAEAALHQLLRALEFMECELQYRLTPLPELCRRTAEVTSGRIREVFRHLADELEGQIAPDAGSCMKAALGKAPDLPEAARSALLELGDTLGRFDLPGQLKGLEGTRAVCTQALEGLSRNRDSRLRGYQTLGLCAGAALAILLI